MSILYSIPISTELESKAVQERLFRGGWKWNGLQGNDYLLLPNVRLNYIIVRSNMTISHCSARWFIANDYRILTPEEFLGASPNKKRKKLI